MTEARACRGCRFPAAVILGARRWSRQFPLSSRDLERLLADRGVAVDPTTLDRWVQRFALELEERLRRHLRPCRGPWHGDEASVRVDGATSTGPSTGRSGPSTFGSAPRGRGRRPSASSAKRSDSVGDVG